MNSLLTATLTGLKNAFRMAVSEARMAVGIEDSDATNAPAGMMQESPELIVSKLLPLLHD